MQTKISFLQHQRKHTNKNMALSKEDQGFLTATCADSAEYEI